MPLLYAISLSAFVFLVIQFRLTGVVARRLHKQSIAGKFALAGSLALLKAIRQFAILAFLLYSVVWICIAVGAFSWSHDAANFGNTVTWLVKRQKEIEKFSSVWKRVLALIVAGALGYTYYFRRKHRVQVEIKNAVEGEARRVMPDIQAESSGLKQPMAPSAGMQSFAAQIRRLDETIATTASETARAQLYQVRATLQHQLLLEDVERRIGRDFEVVPSLKQKRSWAGLLNQGLFDDLKGLPKLATIACHGLLLLSLLSLNANGISDEIAARAARISQAQIVATIRDQRKEFKEIGFNPDPPPENPATPAQPISPQDERTIQRTATYYERAFSDSRIFRTSEQAAPHFTAQSRENLAREAILSDFNSAGTRSQSFRSADLASDDSPVTRTGRRFAEDLRASFRSAPDHLKARFRAKWASYKVPIHPMAAEQFLVNEIFGYGVDDVMSGEGFIADEAKDLVKDLGNHEFNETYKRVRNEMFAGAYGNDSADEALNRVKNPKRAFVRADKAATVREAVSTSASRAESGAVFSAHPPSARVVAAENSSIVELVKDMTSASGERSPALIDPLLEYNDIAPEAAGAEMRTARGALSSALEGAERGMVSTMARVTEESAFRFAMGRNFGMLAGSFRVGGVLIGIDPPAGTLDFRDIVWVANGDRLQLTLVRPNGSTIMAGSFPKATVAQALNYAADGRPLAATMVSAPPLSDLKILAHPALVDTLLGARIIEMDRYVDRFTGDDKQRRLSQELVYGQNDLYALAWYERQSAAGIGDSELHDARTEIASRDAVAALSALETFKNRTTSVLLAKTDFYDRDLVGAMAGCTKKSIDGFKGCIAGTFKNKTPRKEWAGEPPAFQIWSGVRELPYTIDQNLDFLLQKKDELWPFSFLVQVAFTTQPQFAPNALAGYADTTPFELPFLAERVRASVARGIAGSPEELANFQDVREFAVLQRLFRAALKGGLGDQFPMEKLVILKQAARGPLTACRTPRWNPHPGGVEARFLGTIQLLYKELPADGSILSRTKLQVAKCISFAGGRSDADRISVAEWNEACGFEQIAKEAERDCPDKDQVHTAACAAKSVARLATITARTRQIRFAEGIPALESRRQGICVGAPGALK